MRLEFPAELIIEGIARGVERSLGEAARGEFRAFLEEYFGVLDKPEIAAFLGVSERTVNALWEDQTIPKDTQLGEKLPRCWLPALKEALAAGRIKARGVKPTAPKLHAMPPPEKAVSAA